MDITYLANHKEVIPLLSRLFFEEWAYLHPERTLNDFENLILERTNKNRIPVALVAFEGAELLGTVCLKIHDMDTRPDLTPWLAGLYVVAPRRRQGVGAALVAAIEKKAGDLGVKKLYLYTPESEGFYAKLGWKVKERPEYHGYAVTIMEKDITH
jgi:GNAT superfamily N-acetyltransferase